MLILKISVMVLVAYLLGSIPTSVWVGRMFYGIDVREHGSGNAGATNTVRVLGWKAGIPVMIFDVFKGWLAVHMAAWYDPGISVDAMIYLKIGMGAAAVLGHVYPLYVKFRGGKGVATLLGTGIALFPYSAWVAVGIFLVVLLFSGYVSVASISAAITFPFVEIFLFGQENPGLVALSIFVALFVPYTHRKNIRRLFRGEEPKFIKRKKSL